MSFDKWRKRLAGEKVMTFTSPTIEDEGYYRKPITEKAANGSGRNIITGWIPIAYFIESYGTEDRLVGVVGDRDMTDNEVIELWTWCVKYPISEELYRAVERGEPWPDLQDAKGWTIRPPGYMYSDDLADVTKTDVEPLTNWAGHNNPPPDEAVPPDVALADAIDNAIKAAPTTIETDEDAALVGGSRNRIAELKNEANAIRVKEKQPHLDAERKVDGKWQPMIKRAETAAIGLTTLIRKHEQKKRDDAAAAEAAVQRAADRAIASGEPEPPPVVVETSAPLAQVKPTYGRAIPMTEKTFAVIDDQDAVYKHFKRNPRMVTLLQTLAQEDVTAGLAVPGTHTRKGVI